MWKNKSSGGKGVCWREMSERNVEKGKSVFERNSGQKHWSGNDDRGQGLYWEQKKLGEEGILFIRQISMKNTLEFYYE